MLKILNQIYLSNRFFIGIIAIVLLFALGYSFQWLFFTAQIAAIALVTLAVSDLTWLFLNKQGIRIKRKTPERLSLGDENPISFRVQNNFPFKIYIELVEELPIEFQKRNFSISQQLDSGEEKVFDYTLKPVTRGEYKFGQSNIYLSSILGIVIRRIKANNAQNIPVYPSFISMRKFELVGISNRLQEFGIKRIRKVGQHSEFDQVRGYVPSDDSRTVNWKATARRNTLMVNQYQDERSQQVISILDMGRSMEMPFEGMSLLDYAINSSLIISNMAMIKHDKAGIISFSNKINSFVPAERRAGHLQCIMDVLYNQQTDFSESSYEKLYASIASKIRQRSLLILYTNFEGIPSLRRQLPYLKKVASQHLLLVVFFENTEIHKLANKSSHNAEEVYIHSIARKFLYDKKLMELELKQAGIMSLLTTPEGVSVNLINKYLEIKAREMI
ncbi:DUF58 domain-containing protein [uncultured Sunxiuqinia sp.]|uniref:DUF58 domain-containing protein n=1 Tax=uncultured Sunxiuqinia sp. TaxID=1573825 RepID=UPI002AA6E81B|nr:DUF58 domain-containing protein [uncultured Sunxiuqinia sp.]